MAPGPGMRKSPFGRKTVDRSAKGPRPRAAGRGKVDDRINRDAGAVVPVVSPVWRDREDCVKTGCPRSDGASHRRRNRV